MYSWEDPQERVAVLQLNADLRHAQLELLSAECATDRLRLRFSTADIAEFADEVLLSKAIKTVASLNHYYSSLGKRSRRSRQHPPANEAELGPEHVDRAVSLVCEYLKAQRELHFPDGTALDKALIYYKMQRFFSPALLNRVRVVTLDGRRRLSNPSFYKDALQLGLTNLPPIKHMSSLTFIDVIVFHDNLSERALFHGLVHAVQFEVLGLERYVELFVRGFFRTRLHIMVPLEAQVFALDSQFVRSPEESFCVEEQVRLWANQDRY
jgi:hypothetical protein